MPGFVSSISNNNQGVFAENADFSGSIDPSVLNGLRTNGQLWIGSTALNVGNTHINVGQLTSPDNSVIIGYSSPNITLKAVSSFIPNEIIQSFDDFIGYDGVSSNLTWNSVTQLLYAAGTINNPGIIYFGSGNSSSITQSFNNASLVTNPGCFVLGGGVLSFNWVFDIVALSTDTDDYTAYVGITDGTFGVTASGTPTDGVYFKYNHAVNGGKWQIVATSSSVSTTMDSGILAATGFHNFGIIVNANASSVSYYINAVQVLNSPLNSNIPTSDISPAIISIVSAGTLPNQEIDLFYYQQNLTTAR